MLIVLLPGSDDRLFGRSARARNVRVAERMGASIADAGALTTTDAAVALLVPPHIAISAWLVRDAAFLDAVRSAASAPLWVASGPDAAVLVGPPAELHVFTTDLARAASRPRVTVDPDAILSLASAAARGRASWRIVQRTAKKTDGWVSRNFNRPLSRPISYVLLTLGLQANHASLLTLAFGFAAAAVAAQPGYWALLATGLMFQAASVLDGVDGEMARATLTESDSGARLDTIVDQLTYVACYAGVMIGWAREEGGLTPILWTVGIGLALVLSLARAGRFVARHADNASFVFIDRSVRRAARDTGLATLKMAAAAFTLLRRDVFAAIFLIVSLSGYRVLIPGLIVWGVVVANFTFSFHRRELANAARAERLPVT